MLDVVQLMFPLIAMSYPVLLIFADFTKVPFPILVYGQSLHEGLPHLLRMLDVVQLMFPLMARSSPCAADLHRLYHSSPSILVYGQSLREGLPRAEGHLKLLSRPQFLTDRAHLFTRSSAYSVKWLEKVWQEWKKILNCSHGHSSWRIELIFSPGPVLIVFSD